MIILQSLTRVIAFVRTEIVQVVRRPSALLSLIVGPFLIMAVFGLGYVGIRPQVRAIVVVPPQSGLPTDVKAYSEPVRGVQVLAVETSAAKAEQELRDGLIDAVIIYPADMQSKFSAGQQSTIDVEVSIANPTDLLIAEGWSDELSTWTNQKMISTAVSTGETQAPASVKKIPPDVVAAPTKAEVKNLAPAGAGVVSFFGPAVLILILQHLCVTLVALSVLLERKSGIFEIYRVSPTNAWEIVAGKFIAFMLIGAVIAAISLALLVLGLHVPMLAGVQSVAWILGLVLAASIGMGLLLGVISDSERTAVQGSLLILLASIFFSGFIIELDLFVQPLQAAAQAIPATQGIALVHKALLFGSMDESGPQVALGAITAITVIAAWFLLRRSMAAMR